MPDILLFGIRFALFANLMFVAGLAAFILYAPTAEERRSPEAMSGFWKAERWLCASGVTLSILGMAALTANMQGVDLRDIEPRMIWDLARESDVGAAWLWRTAALLLAFLVAIRAAKRPALAAGTIAMAGTIALASLAWSGHAGATEGTVGIIHRASDALHMVAAAVWLGGIAAFMMLLARASTTRLNLASRSLDQFSRVGTICVLILAATGLLNGQIIVDANNVGASLAAPYGKLLLAKLALFTLMLGLAAANRWRLTPALQGALSAASGTTPEPAIRAIRRGLMLEAAAGAAIIALVAWFGMLEPVPSPAMS